MCHARFQNRNAQEGSLIRSLAPRSYPSSVSPAFLRLWVMADNKAPKRMEKGKSLVSTAAKGGAAAADCRAFFPGCIHSHFPAAAAAADAAAASPSSVVWRSMYASGMRPPPPPAPCPRQEGRARRCDETRDAAPRHRRQIAELRRSDLSD